VGKIKLTIANMGNIPFGKNGSNLLASKLREEPAMKKQRVKIKTPVRANWTMLMLLVPLKLIRANTIKVRIANVKGSTHLKK
jgi:hypothetical protein